MWFLLTRQRPVQCQRALDGCVATGMQSPGLVVIDGPRDGYEGLRLPANWSVRPTDEHLEMCGVLRWIVAQYPEEAQYGLLYDDVVPRTPGWDACLEAVAGPWGISCANDLLHAPGHWTPGVLGGALVRAVWWLAPAGLIHLYIDDVWQTLDGALKLFVDCPAIILEEFHFSNGKAPYDATYQRVYRGESYADRDRQTFEHWRDTEAPGVIARVRTAREEALCGHAQS